MEHFFTTYIRTKLLFQHRLKDLKDYSKVKIYVYELKKLGVNSGPLLHSLKARGEIEYDSDGFFKVLKDGPIDPALLKITRKRERVPAPLEPVHYYMRDQLMFVTINVPKKELPVYFKAFLQYRSTQLHEFFTVDAFSGRVHTPIVNLKGNLRSKLRLHGSVITSLDVKQMQPTILAKVLYESIGSNPFSEAVFTGEDVYNHLLERNKTLQDRSAAKKLLFQLIFGKPMQDIGNMFEGDSRWVNWINDYKSNEEPRNPHKRDKHTNLAWLLQYSEVQVMKEVWQQLMARRIPFLTIHDDVLVMKRHKDVAFKVMDSILGKHFKQFVINIDHSV